MKLGLLACSVVLSASASAQTSATPKHVSHYMQETGLLYVETTNKLMSSGLVNSDATQLIDPALPSEVNHYGEVLQELEDRIQINISSATDKQYLRLLQRTKAAADLAVFGDLSTLYVDCYSAAHQTALRGSLSLGSCTQTKYEEAAEAVSAARLREAQANLETAKQHLADVENGVPELTPVQKELCAKDATFNFCAGTPERKAYDNQKRKELCAKGVYDKDYCAKFQATQPPSPNK